MPQFPGDPARSRPHPAGRSLPRATGNRLPRPARRGGERPRPARNHRRRGRVGNRGIRGAARLGCISAPRRPGRAPRPPDPGGNSGVWVPVPKGPRPASGQGALGTAGAAVTTRPHSHPRAAKEPRRPAPPLIQVVPHPGNLPRLAGKGRSYPRRWACPAWGLGAAPPLPLPAGVGGSLCGSGGAVRVAGTRVTQERAGGYTVPGAERWWGGKPEPTWEEPRTAVPPPHA